MIRPRGQATTISRSTETNVATSPLSSKQHRIHERLTPRRRAHHTPTFPTLKASYPEAISHQLQSMYPAKFIYFYLLHPITHRHISAIGQHFHTFFSFVAKEGAEARLTLLPPSTIHLTEPLSRSWIARSILPPPHHQLQAKWLQNDQFADSASFLFSSSPFGLVLSSCGGNE